MTESRSQTDDRQRVLDATDIVRLVGEHLSLKAKGREFVGLCPFHDDHKPSMFVAPHKQIYHCFSCGAGGNAIDFMINYHRIDFREALRLLAERGGIELAPPKKRDDAPTDEAGAEISRADLTRANQLALDFFRTILKHPEHGAAARAAVEARGISPEMAERFELGAAPDRWEGLLLTARKRGFAPAVMLEAGLARARSSEGGGHYDAFRNRLIFPILDQIGRPMAFGGRIIDPEDEPKYINSPETRLFDKSSTLYGIRQAFRAIQTERRAIVTEGYTDVIACHQQGFENVVATLGTALTPRHATVLRRLCDEVVLLFDGDAAGMKAADRAVEVFFAEPLDVKIAVLPDGQDPDDLFRTDGGKDRFTEAIESAADALEYRFERRKREMADAGVSGRARMVQEDLQRLVELGLEGLNPIRRRLVIRRLASLAGVDEQTIIEAMPRRRRRERPEAATTGSAAPDRRLSAAEHALGCLLCEPSLRLTIDGPERDVWAPSAYPPGPAQVVAEVFQAAAERAEQEEEAGEPTLSVVLAMLDDAEARRFATHLAAATERSTDNDDRRLHEHWRQCVRRAWRDMLATSETADTAGRSRKSEGETDGLATMIEQIERRRSEHERFGGNPLVVPRPTSG